MERCRRYPETAISVNTLIAGFTVFFRLIVGFFFRVTPACTLKMVVYVIYFLREQMILTGKQRNPAMKNDGQNFSTCFTRRLYSATVPTDSIYGKKFVKVQS